VGARVHVLFVESNTSGTGALFCRSARARGLVPVLLASDPGRYPFVADGDLAGAIRVEQGDTSRPEAVLEVARGLLADGGLAGITSTSEYYVEIAALAAVALGLPAPAPEAVRTCRSKRRLAEVLEAAGVRVPPTRGARSAAQAAAAARDLGLPVVVKPVAGSGSVGVRRADTAEVAGALAEALLAVRTNERGLPNPAEVLVQAMIVGREYSVECIGGRVVGVTAKHLGGPDGTFVETGHDFPAAPSDEVRAVAEITRRALDAVGFAFGPTHTEVRVDTAGPGFPARDGPLGPAVIEVNPRLAGGFIPQIVRHATGVDLIDAALAAVTGGPVDLAPRRALHASIRFLTAPGDGPLERIDGVEAAEAVPGVVEVASYRRPGDAVARRGDFRDRIGHVIGVAEDVERAAAAAERALATLQPRLGGSDGR
jgi:S-sulfo-L-cysteine synthase (3-phospho-L-serine-dependent)